MIKVWEAYTTKMCNVCEQELDQAAQQVVLYYNFFNNSAALFFNNPYYIALEKWDSPRGKIVRYEHFFPA